MSYREINSWAKSKNYSVLKQKGEDIYLWTHNEDAQATGICYSWRDLATQIYNHMTDNQWLEYQEEYKRTKDIKYE